MAGKGSSVSLDKLKRIAIVVAIVAAGVAYFVEPLRGLAITVVVTIVLAFVLPWYWRWHSH